MIVETPTRQLLVFVKHKEERIVLGMDRHGNERIATHCTEVVIRDKTDLPAPGEVAPEVPSITEAKAFCAETDNFSRREGCRRALIKAFAADKEHNLATEERRAIFHRVCPKLVVNQKTKAEAEAEAEA